MSQNGSNIPNKKEISKELSRQFVLEDIIGTAIKIPGVKVDRDKFLVEQFASSNLNLKDILERGPVEAGVPREVIAKLVNKHIFVRTSQSSMASFVAGIPGGFAMAATIPADIMQFFGMALRLAQEISYFYGARDLWVNGRLDDERVKSQLIMYCGVMFGVSGAVSGVRVLSTQIAKTALEKLPEKALTKTFWFPIVKQVGKAIGLKVTKSTVVHGVSKAIPVIGGVVSGALNFASMMPMATRLFEEFDKSTFDYSEAEFEKDLITVEQMAEGQFINVKPKATLTDDIKSKVADGFKTVGEKASGIFSSFGKKTGPKQPTDPTESALEKLKGYKELLDLGILTQEEFDQKKKELLDLI